MSLLYEQTIRTIPLEKTDADPQNPRKTLDVVVEEHFQESLRQHGQLQPIIVTEVGDRFRIRDGHRRVAGLRTIGQTTALAVIVKPEVSENELLLMATLLNSLRSNLDPLEKAEAWKQIQQDQGWNLSQLAQAVSEDLGTVSKTLSLLKLIPEAQALLRQGCLKYIRGYEWSKLPVEEQRKHVHRLVSDTSSKIAKNPSHQRVVCHLQSGITVSVSGKELTIEAVQFSLEFVLKECRKQKGKVNDVTTLGKLFQDQAKAGGQP